MNKIIMLGTGNGGVVNLYNTCFVIQNDYGNFLVDTGSSMEIVKRLSKVNIKLEEINNIFISHAHSDHILGLINIFKKIGFMALNGEYSKKLNIYCNDYVYEAITNVAKYTLPDKVMEYVYKVVDFIILKDSDKYIINGVEYTFFDLRNKNVKIYGFECFLDGKRLVFLGDINPSDKIKDRIVDADYVMVESFCLDSEEDVFHAHIGNHSTVKDVCIYMRELNVKNLILYHTEETHGENRKELYTKEGQEYFLGKVIVPDDLECIDIV